MMPVPPATSGSWGPAEAFTEPAIVEELEAFVARRKKEEFNRT